MTIAALFCVNVLEAQLSVIVSPPKITGQKAVLPLTLKNEFSVKIESARAVAFLIDEQGKVIGQSTRWVIGGSQDTAGLPPGGTNTFNFVVQAHKPLTTTNLTAKLTFNRLILENGKLAELNKSVHIESPTR